VRLEEVPDILAELATVQMHAIQTSGNCIRNITTDPFAGVAADELFDPRPYCEIVRQWSTLAPEFLFLPRKFKIAISGGAEDRAAVRFHDIGARARMAADGRLGFEIHVGGGLGRTPMVGRLLKDFLPREELLNYFEAILRVYNRHGRRDNKYKARIKILVKDLTLEGFAREVEDEWAWSRGGPATLGDETFRSMEAFFARHDTAPAPADGTYRSSPRSSLLPLGGAQRQPPPGRRPGHRDPVPQEDRRAPGDATAEQMDGIAALAERYSAGEIRVSHEQNLVLPHVARGDLPALWQGARALGLATPNIGLLTDLVCCPGGDFCSLANARSIPVAAPSSSASTTWTTSSTWARWSSTCPAASTPAATTTSATSASSAWIRTTRSGTRSPSAAGKGRGALGRVIGPPSPRSRSPT
jgi:sulfite reductase (NADPH) hemoprotein beta-component